MKNLRTNGFIGIYEDTDSLNPVSLHFSEWWSGEGADFAFDEKKISLNIEEMKAITVAACLMNMIDLDDVIQEVSEIRAESLKRQRDIEAIAANLR